MNQSCKKTLTGGVLALFMYAVPVWSHNGCPVDFLPYAESPQDFCELAFRSFLERTPEMFEEAYWTKMFETGNARWGLIRALADSEEYRQATPDSAFMVIAFQAVLKRFPLPEEYAAGCGVLRDGLRRSELIRQLLASHEFARLLLFGPGRWLMPPFHPAAYANAPEAAEKLGGGYKLQREFITPVVLQGPEPALAKGRLPIASAGIELVGETFVEPPYGFYRGFLHSHTSFSIDAGDGGTPDEAYEYARDVAKMDFLGVSDHDFPLSDAAWFDTWISARSHTQGGRFVAFCGFEWSSPFFGHVTVVNTPVFTNAYTRDITLPDLFDWLKNQDQSGIFATLNHPGYGGDTFGTDLNHLQYVDGLEEVIVGIENLRTSGYDEYRVGFEGEYSFYEEANLKGWHVAPVTAQDNHSRGWGTRNGGRTVVLAEQLTPESLIAGYKARRVYSTSDPNVKVTFYGNGEPMGAKLSGGQVRFEVSYTDPDGELLRTLEVKANGDLLLTSEIGVAEGTWTFTVRPDRDAMWYYVHMIQEDGDEVFTAPIWVAAGAPSDRQAPFTAITDPKGGSFPLALLEIRGTSQDQGAAGLAAVWVSVDGGNTFEKAHGTTAWTFAWTPPDYGTYTVVAQGEDANGNRERPGPSVILEVTPPEPRVLMAGYALTALTTGGGGLLDVWAIARPLETHMIGLETPEGTHVDFLWPQRSDSGVTLFRTGIDLPPGVPPVQLFWEMHPYRTLLDDAMVPGPAWPWLTVE